MRALAVQKASQIQEILNRKEMFEKSWLVLLHFATHLTVLRTQFEEKKSKEELEKHRDKMAYRITRFWKKYFPLPKLWRTRRFARSY